jgi:NAD dependent epimerase/dehydratase
VTISLQGKRVLVTGAGGFIGSHLSDALVRAGATVRGMVHYNGRGEWGQIGLLPAEIRNAIEVVLGDIRDRSAVCKAIEGCEIIFHLPALIGIPYSYAAPQSYVETNITGTLNLLEACRDCGVGRLIQTSTSEVYGTAQYTPIDELHPLHAQSPYAATKIGSDQLAYSYFAAFELPVVIVRPFNTFGPRQSTRAVIPTIITQALASSDIQLGSVTPVRDFLFVRDTARGFMAAAAASSEKVVGEVINLGTGRGVTIASVVELVSTILKKPLHVKSTSDRQRPEKSEVLALIASADKAAERTGWRPSTTLQDGLVETVHWIESNRHQFRSDGYSI